ncbi:GRAM domain-containing protein 1B [Folsomia candida]|uniref:GRAM domain-containing protein 1B n=1 Tax=Folsomia candida TaxID=158441 RepID=A0A226EUB5_FOLCA|nr:GRAM domain-containing protein 1B [Folsomia candida]
MHHHSEDKDITTPSSSAGDGTTPFKSQSSSNERRLSKDNGDDTFVSAMDLSSVLNSSQISTSSSDSNSSSASCHYSSSTSTDCSSALSASISTSVNSKSSSEKSAGGESSADKKRKQKLNDNTTVGCEGSPVFATCTTFSSSSSTTSASTVRRSESWGALRSASIESSKSGGSDKENFSSSGADLRTSVSSMNESRRQHNHHNPDTYHTPSASMHSISRSQSNSSESQRVGDEAKSGSTNNLATNNKIGHDVTLDSSTTCADVKKDLAELVNRVPNIEALEFIESQQLKPSTSLATTLGEEINNGKAEKDRRLSGIIEIMGIDMNELGSSESNASKEGSIGVGPTSKELAKAAKLARKPAKKRMWYQQIFSASYKSRSGDFKKLFKELPIKERLLVDYSCALQKEILVQGRMYVSQGYLSFHANIFGWETQTSIRLRDVTSITKEKTALVIPNAIQVIVDCGDKLFFTSFVTRDATYLMLFKLWQNALLEDGMPSKEIQRLIHSSYGEELVITSDDEIDESLSCKSIAVGDLTDNPSMAAEFEQSKPILISNDTKVRRIIIHLDNNLKLGEG